jgi:hypothetical protein
MFIRQPQVPLEALNGYSTLLLELLHAAPGGLERGHLDTQGDGGIDDILRVQQLAPPADIQILFPELGLDVNHHLTIEAGLLELIVGMVDDAQWMAWGGGGGLYTEQTQGVRLQARPVGMSQGQTQWGAQCCILKVVHKNKTISLFFGRFLQFTHNFNENCFSISFLFKSKSDKCSSIGVLYKVRTKISSCWVNFHRKFQ